MKHKPKTLLYASLMLPSMWLLMSNEAFAATGALNLNDFKVGAGGRVTVPVTINITEGDLAGFLITLTYDESVVDVLNESDIAINPAFLGMSNVSVPGETKITGVMSTSGLTGNVNLANVTFTGTGSPTATTNVTVTPDPGNFVDSTTAAFSPDPSADTAIATVVDLTPDAFSFPNQVNVPLNTSIESAPVTVTGIDPATPISITGGEYKIDNGEFTTAPGTINSGQVVTLRIQSSTEYSTATTAFLKVGTGGDDFKVTTLTFGDQTPDAFAFANQSNVPLGTVITSAPVIISGIDVPTPISITAGGEYSIDNGEFTSAAGTINSGQSVVVRITSSDQFTTAVSTTLKVGTGGDDFRVTTSAQDIIPNQFSFIDKIDVPRSSEITSDTVTISGINSPTAISITGGTYSINAGPYTAESNLVSNEDKITVKLNSSAEFATPTAAILTVGTISDEFSATTIAADTTPEPFTFSSITEAPISTVETSNTITVEGIEAPATITITGGEYAIGTGDFTSAPGTVSNGDQVTVKQTSSENFSTLTTATLTIGDVSSTFDVTTVADVADTTPNQFTFEDQNGVDISTLIESAPITISGIGSPATISVTGGDYAIGNGDFVSTEGTVANGETVKVRHTSAATYLTSTDTVLIVGEVSDTFTSVTMVDPTADVTPEQFNFTDLTDVALDTLIESAPITITGIEAPTSITISGGEYAIGNGDFTALDGTVNNNDTVRVRLISSTEFSTPVSTTLTVGGVSDDFTITTIAEDTEPEAFTLSAILDAPLNTIETSNTVTVSGINAPAPISVTNGEYSINGTDFTSADGTVENGDEVVVRNTSSVDFATTVSTTLSIGGVSANFDITTIAEPVNDAPILQSIPDQNVKVDTSLTFTAQATDPNDDTLSFSLNNAPKGAVIDPASGVFSWTPTETGTFTFDVTVSDGTLSDSQTVTVTVSAESVIVPEPTPATPAAAIKKDTCGDTCEKYKDFKAKYKTKESKQIYMTLKDMRENDPASFARLESIYRNYRDWSDNERQALNSKTLSEFKLFKSYAGYKHYRNLKERLDK